MKALIRGPFFIFGFVKALEKIYAAYLRAPVITTDSRKEVKDTIFFALKGDRFDGNKFVEDVLGRDPKLVVCSDDQWQNHEKCIVVEDTLKTLQDLSHYHKKQQKSLTVIGLTGSNGKTTTKELLYSVLQEKYSCICTAGNFNNHIGVPLTLLRIRPEHDIAVVEMGTNNFGEIKTLCKIADPDMGIITNIGKAHLEFFIDEEGVSKAKGELGDYLEVYDRPLFLSRFEESLKSFSSRPNIIWYGENYKGLRVNCRALHPEIKLEIWNGDKKIDFQVELSGKHNYQNVLTAIALGHELNLSLEQISNGLGRFEAKGNRSEEIKTENNRVLLDAYNANPSSMNASLDNFKGIAPDGLLILGDMKELGESSPAYHQGIVDRILEENWKQVFLVGSDFSKTKCDDKRVRTFLSREDLEEYLKISPIKGRYILLKASRSIGLEKLLHLL